MPLSHSSQPKWVLAFQEFVSLPEHCFPRLEVIEERLARLSPH